MEIYTCNYVLVRECGLAFGPSQAQKYTKPVSIAYRESSEVLSDDSPRRQIHYEKKISVTALILLLFAEICEEGCHEHFVFMPTLAVSYPQR